MTLLEKTEKLLEFSVIIKNSEKKNWRALMSTMSEKQVETLYHVLADEIRAWKKDGISIISDPILEASLVGAIEHGASITALKARLEGKTAPAQLPKSEPVQTPFVKELNREVNTPELESHKNKTEHQSKPALPPTPKILETKKPNPSIQPEKPIHLDAKNSWMLNKEDALPKSKPAPVTPRPLAVPRVRNRVSKHGLNGLDELTAIDDISKIEAAHLRQGPLLEQINIIKRKIIELAEQNDMLPATLLPVFQQSPLFQTYLKAGAMLIERNAGPNKLILDQIMAELEGVGQDTLSQQEFEAVADLRKDLEIISGL